MPILYIVRGLPGSGKTTLANKIGCVVFSADHWLTKDNVYKFTLEDAKRAHKRCRSAACSAMNSGIDVAVANTFTRAADVASYLELAESHGHTPVIFTCRGDYGSIHNVPAERIEKMRVALAACESIVPDTTGELNERLKGLV